MFLLVLHSKNNAIRYFTDVFVICSSCSSCFWPFVPCDLLSFLYCLDFILLRRKELFGSFDFLLHLCFSFQNFHLPTKHLLPIILLLENTQHFLWLQHSLHTAYASGFHQSNILFFQFFWFNFGSSSHFGFYLSC